MSRRKEPAIPADVLDRLLAGSDAAVFSIRADCSIR
jgi:hypothetical protein